MHLFINLLLDIPHVVGMHNTHALCSIFIIYECDKGLEIKMGLRFRIVKKIGMVKKN